MTHPITWQQVFPTHAPSIREADAPFGRTFDYDPVHDVSTLFGGVHGFSFLHDTWNWDGIDWTDVTPTHFPPIYNGIWGMYQYDTNNGDLYIWDGNNVQTWKYNHTDWTQVTTTHNPGSSKYDFGFAFDEIRDKHVIFGGDDDSIAGFWPVNANTTVFDRTDWTSLSPTHSPSARKAHLMCYDRHNGYTVLYGGVTGTTGSPVPVHDTYIWNGTDWLVQSPAHNPGNISSSRWFMQYCPFLKCVVIWDETDIWQWDDASTDWIQNTPVFVPPTRDLCFISTGPHGGIVMFGGRISGTDLDETWLLVDLAPPIPVMANEISLI